MRPALPVGSSEYLDGAGARRTLTDLYGNPPAPEVRALIVPPGSSVVDNTFVIVVMYENDGHVGDSDAASSDYEAMLQSEQEASSPRTRTGRWAGTSLFTPSGGPTARTTTRARTSSTGRATSSSGAIGCTRWNYEARTFGRAGMLSLTAVSATPDIALVRSGMQTVLGASRFVDGRRYEDFREGDRVSKLTIAAVVAYAVAKTGLIALLLARLKFLVLGIAALVTALRKRLFHRSDRRGPAATI